MTAPFTRTSTAALPKIEGDQVEIATALAELGGDVEWLVNDYCQPCCICERKFFVGFSWEHDDVFDADIREQTGERCCEGCAPEYAENTMDTSTSAMRSAYGTWGR